MNQMPEKFTYQRQVHFYETDLMKIVHHANYLRFAEETRVAWAFAREVLTKEAAEEASRLAVLKTEVRHIASARFGDELRIELQARRIGIRIVFEYKIWIQDSGESVTGSAEVLAAEVRTEHVAINASGKAEKPTAHLKAVMEKEQWIETWLSNL